MPGKQTAQASKATATTTARKPAQPRTPSRSAPRTGERDANYDLISVLYHALQGADTISQYLEDARDGDDEELLSFLEETQETYVERAAEAKLLLANRLESAGEDEDEDEDEEDEDEDEDEQEEED